MPLLPAGAPTAIAETESGFPQSMQNRESDSFFRPQCAQVVTSKKAPASRSQRFGWPIYGLIQGEVN